MTPEEYNSREMKEGRLTTRHIVQLVKFWQKENKLQVDGKAGTATQTSLDFALSGSVIVKESFAGWVKPMPEKWKKRPLRMTSGFSKEGSGPNKSRYTHLGNDFMYKRRIWGKVKHPEYTRGFWCPDGVPFFSIGPGEVSFAQWRNDRWIVVVDHGRIDGVHLKSWYSHAKELHIEEKQKVEAGTPLGIVGHTGSNVNHLHLGLRNMDLGDTWLAQNIDPWPFVKTFLPVYL